MRFSAALLAVLGAVWVVCGGGCAKKHPPAVVSNRVLEPGEENQKAILSSQDRSEALAAMQSGTGKPPRNAQRPGRAPQGVRWSDIPVALEAQEGAFGEQGVEMTVVRKVEQPDEYAYELRTVEGWPGTLVIRRVDGDQVYEITELRIGRFPDDPERVERAEALVRAFRQHLKRLGAQDWFND
jgi:hypothetical protein